MLFRAYIQTGCHAVHLFARTFQSDAEAMGSTRWGQKVPSVPLSNAIAIRQFLPRTKVVYLVRDVGDCLRSIKAYRETRRRDPAEFCRLWVDNVRSRSEEHTSELQSLMRISYAV